MAEGPSINFMIFIFLFVENCLLYDAIHDFPVLLRADSNLADNRFQAMVEIALFNSNIFMYITLT